MKAILSIFIAGSVLLGCKYNKSEDIYTLLAKDANGYYQMVVEIPSGTNAKIEYHTESQSFQTDIKNGKERIIAFLPYPANYGFIPGTLSDKSKGGDGDPVDILLIAPSVKTGTVIPVIPIAMLKLLDNGEEDFKVLAVPQSDSLNVLHIHDLKTLDHQADAIKMIIQTWFQNYDTDSAQVLGWADRLETIEYIENNIHQQ